MANALKIILLLFTLLDFGSIDAQSEKRFCKAVDKENFHRVARFVKQQLKQHRYATEYANPEVVTFQAILTTYTPNIDSIAAWLRNFHCVADVSWDKCMAKAAIYPGHSTIGVKFKTRNGEIEKCFLLQEGTTGRVNIFGWHLKLSKSKTKLVYKRMYDCSGFIEMQKKNCAGL